MVSLVAVPGFALTADSWSACFSYIKLQRPDIELSCLSYSEACLKVNSLSLQANYLVLHSVSSLLSIDIPLNTCALKGVVLLEPMIRPSDASQLLVQLAASHNREFRGKILNYLSKYYGKSTVSKYLDYAPYHDPEVISAMSGHISGLAANSMARIVSGMTSYRKILIYTSNGANALSCDDCPSCEIINFQALDTHNSMIDRPRELASILLASTVMS